MIAKKNEKQTLKKPGEDDVLRTRVEETAQEEEVDSAELDAITGGTYCSVHAEQFESLKACGAPSSFM